MMQLSEAEIAYAKEFSAQIDILNTVQILQYGSVPQKRMMNFSDSALRSLPSTELWEIAEELQTLQKALRTFSRDYDNMRYTNADFRVLYDRMEAKIIETQRRMQIHQEALLRHIKLLERSYDALLTNIREYDLYILAGNECLRNCTNVKLPALQERMNRSSDVQMALSVQDYQDAMHRFEKKIEDLKVSRQIPLHTLSQVRILQNNDGLMIENLRRLIANGFPLWKESITLALGLSADGKTIDSRIFHDSNDLLMQSLTAMIHLQKQALEEREKLMAVADR